MKRNAIVRIVLYSLIITILLTLLFFGLGVRNLFGKRSTVTPVETVVSTLTESPLESGNKLTFNPDSVQDLKIEWAAGSIAIFPADVEEITVFESDVSDSKYTMVCKTHGNTLILRFCDDNWEHGFRVKGISKDLTIMVPRNWQCSSLEIDAASASVEVNGLTIREVEFDGASGKCEFSNCTVDIMDLDTASGDIEFYGSLNILECDAASASFTGVLTNHPTRLDMETMSGDLDITLPEDCGFTVNLDGLRTNFTSDYPTTVKNGDQVYGDGSCRINISAMSGDVCLRMPQGTTEVAEG